MNKRSTRPTLPVGQALSEAFTALDAGRLDRARALVQPLRALTPEPAGVAYLLGVLALADGQGRKAAQHLLRAVRQAPGAMPPLLAYARAQSQQRRLAEANAAYRGLVAMSPDMVVAWRELADLRFTDRDFAGARHPLQTASRLRPDLAELRNNLGIAERAAGNLVAAEQCFRLALLLDPGSAKACANLAALIRRRPEGRPQAVICAARAANILPDHGAFQIELGQAYLALCDDLAALPCFEQACLVLPGQAEPHWLLAETLRRLSRDREAAKAYETVLRVDPNDSFGARLALAQLGQAPLPAGAANAHIGALYDQYAQSFDQDLRQNLAYSGPEILAEALTRLGIGGPLDILDAGCGTGLAGVAVRPLARRLDGVDLSAKMAAQARARGIYDEVSVDDLLHFLDQRPAHYDLIVAADVLIYQGDLTLVARAGHGALRSGGHVAFTVEESPDAPIRMQSTGRFAHSADHLRTVAVRQGFVLTLLEQTATRREGGIPVPSLLCVWEKP